LYGPADTNTIWSGFGGDCETYDDGDGTVAYDRLADRLVIQQFAFDPQTLNPPYTGSAPSSCQASREYRWWVPMS
jgi:hypothetical protein